MENQIIELLQQMQQQINGMQSQLNGLQQQADGVRQEVRDTKQELTAQISVVDEKVTKTQLIIETELRPNIQILAEGHGPIADSVNAVKESIEVMEPQLEIVSAVVRRNSKKIDAIEHTVFAH